MGKRIGGQQKVHVNQYGQVTMTMDADVADHACQTSYYASSGHSIDSIIIPPFDYPPGMKGKGKGGAMQGSGAGAGGDAAADRSETAKFFNSSVRRAHKEDPDAIKVEPYRSPPGSQRGAGPGSQRNNTAPGIGGGGSARSTSTRAPKGGNANPLYNRTPNNGGLKKTSGSAPLAVQQEVMESFARMNAQLGPEYSMKDGENAPPGGASGQGQENTAMNRSMESNATMNRSMESNRSKPSYMMTAAEKKAAAMSPKEQELHDMVNNVDPNISYAGHPLMKKAMAEQQGSGRGKRERGPDGRHQHQHNHYHVYIQSPTKGDAQQAGSRPSTTPSSVKIK